MRQKD